MMFDGVAQPILALPRASKRLLAIIFDSALCALTVWAAFYLRLGYFVSLTDRPLVPVILSIVLAIPIFYVTGLYRSAFRRIGMEFIPAISGACLIYGVAYAAVISAYAFDNVPRTLGIIQPILLFIAVSIMRLSAGRLLGGTIGRRARHAERRHVLIYGAGSSGRQLASALGQGSEYKIVGFVDDDASLQGTHVDGVRVYSARKLEELIDSKNVDEVFLALPSASSHRRQEILNQLREIAVAVRTLPSLLDLADGRVDATDLRELTVEDLLAREPVPLALDAVREKFEGKVVLVSGAGGSIGSELCRKIATARPKHLLLLENSEFALYAIHRKLADIPDLSIVPLLGSVTDEERLRRIVNAWQPAAIFHAAAYKHVPLVEHNPLEGLQNNVIGTLRLAKVAIEAGVSDFVLVSTDKAVRPTNIMGATKRLAELVLQGLTQLKTGTRFSMVRFGNVLGSSGSVVPLFRDQIHKGGPVTITHPEITRYFMTIPEAAQLVIQASVMAQGGEVFVLDMGAPVRIYDLAKRMVELSGRSVRSSENPHGDIEIVTIGMRPGEKLFEELLIGGNPQATNHPRIMMAREDDLPWPELSESLAEMERLIVAGDVVKARELLNRLIPEYEPNKDIVDWLFIESRCKKGDGDWSATARQTRFHRP